MFFGPVLSWKIEFLAWEFSGGEGNLLLTKEALDPLLVRYRNQSTVPEAKFCFLGLVAHHVRRVSLKTLHLTGPGNLETLFCTTVRLHLRHSTKFFTNGAQR